MPTKVKFCSNLGIAAAIAVGAVGAVTFPHAHAQPSPATTPASKAARASVGKKREAAADKSQGKETLPEESAFAYNLPGPDGKAVPLANFKGKYILIVNLGRKSSYNVQLAALIKLNDIYKDKGVVVLGVPSNDFGAAEPGADAEIQKAYADAKVDFQVMGVCKLAGDEELPLFIYLTKSKDAPPGGPVHWNYTKFVIDKTGRVIARLGPDVAPDSPEMLSTLDKILEGRFKQKKEEGKAGLAAASSDGDDEN